VTRNLLHGNSRDLFVEVSHGPYVVDHNVLASPVAIEIFSQGGAYLNNLVGGTVRLEQVLDRATPYHLPHSTQVAGYANIPGGDDRWVGNVFVASDRAPYAPGSEPGTFGHGTAGYDGRPASWDEYRARLDAAPPGDHVRFAGVAQAVYVHDNVYAGGARPFAGEERATVLDGPASIAIASHGGNADDEAERHLEVTLPEGFDAVRLAPVGGRDLPPVRFVGAEFEELDGTPLVATTDLTGTTKDADARHAAGPLAALTSGTTRHRVR